MVDGPRSVTAIADDLAVSGLAVSQHLKVLLGAGLVDARQDGLHRSYSVRIEGLEPVRIELESSWGPRCDAGRPADSGAPSQPRPRPP